MNQSITLYYRAGTSDKVYTATLEAKGTGHVVDYAYGRRGGPMNTGTKTTTPVDYETAKKVYDTLIRKKTAKGYTPGPDGTRYQHTQHEQRDSGIVCQLPHPVAGPGHLAALIESPDFCMQEKFDGRRLLIRKYENVLEGVNRRGLKVGVPEPVFRTVSDTVPGDCILDGECLGEEYVVFDVLRSDGADVQGHPYRYRLDLLEALVPRGAAGSALRRIETAFESDEKQEVLDWLARENAEGVVFKHLDAPYTTGRAAATVQAKHKFYETASFVAGETNRSKRSVALTLYRGGESVPAGHVTIPSNHPVPKAGAVVEVRYLYAFPESGSVYQPVYLGKRDDVTARECTVDQLKYKPAGDPVPA